MSLLDKIYLIDSKPELVDAWSIAFDGLLEVSPICGDYFDIEADAMVSPANSFGYMDGGLDRAILYEVGQDLQEKVQSVIVRKHHGELPVGSAEIVSTNNEKWPFLIVAPTMRVPENVSSTFNAYAAFRAILLAIVNANKENKVIRSVICPGLGSGIGGLDPYTCATQMRLAYKYISEPTRILEVEEIYRSHELLTSDRPAKSMD